MNAKQYREQRDKALQQKWRLEDAIKDINNRVAAEPHAGVQKVLDDLEADMMAGEADRG